MFTAASQLSAKYWKAETILSIDDKNEEWMIKKDEARLLIK